MPVYRVSTKAHVSGRVVRLITPIIEYGGYIWNFLHPLRQRDREWPLEN
jgi:hypothetical protein